MSDYYQPDFYRFSEDSLLLVNFIRDELRGSETEALEIGPGSGVISIELLQTNPLLRVTVIELQEAFEQSLQKNLKLFSREADVYIDDFLSVEMQKKFDVIYTNPPYFFRDNSRESSTRERDLCRRMERQSWELWLEKVKSLLSKDGSFFFCHKESEGLFSEDHWRVEKKKELKGLSLFLLKARS